MQEIPLETMLETTLYVFFTTFTMGVTIGTTIFTTVLTTGAITLLQTTPATFLIPFHRDPQNPISKKLFQDDQKLVDLYLKRAMAKIRIFQIYFIYSKYPSRNTFFTMIQMYMAIRCMGNTVFQSLRQRFQPQSWICEWRSRQQPQPQSLISSLRLPLPTYPQPNRPRFLIFSQPPQRPLFPQPTQPPLWTFSGHFPWRIYQPRFQLRFLISSRLPRSPILKRLVLLPIQIFSKHSQWQLFQMQPVPQLETVSMQPPWQLPLRSQTSLAQPQQLPQMRQVRPPLLIFSVHFQPQQQRHS